MYNNFEVDTAKMTRNDALAKRSKRFIVLTHIGIWLIVILFFFVWILALRTQNTAVLLPTAIISGVFLVFIVIQVYMLDLEKWALYAFCFASFFGIVVQLINQNWLTAFSNVCYMLLYLRKDWTLFQWDFPKDEKVSDNTQSTHQPHEQ